MDIQEATDLIRHPAAAAASWADLGCGTGTFTLALANLLPAGSIIHAVDRDQQALAAIPATWQQVHISKTACDFAEDPLSFHQLDGILMANSWHYIREKERLLNKLRPILSKHGRWLVVEYDTGQANRWVPYPLSFHALQLLFGQAGYQDIQLLGHRPSLYQQRNLYAALVQ